MYKNESFYLGESFHSLAQKAVPEDVFDDDGRLFVPYVVNLAFACELYLKSLVSDGISQVRGHRWDDLFSKVSEKNQEAIHNHPYFKGDDQFGKKLIENGKIFESWRYCFEPKKQAFVDLVFLEHFAEVVHGLAEQEVRENSVLAVPNPVDKLVQACERLFELDSLALSDAYYYSSLPLCVIDAVFSIGVKYTSTENTVRRYCEYFQVKKYDRNRTSTKMQHSISEFIANIEKIGIARSADIVFKNHQRTSARNGILKAEAVVLFAKVLQKYGVETFEDLHAKGLSEEAESELKQIPGQRSGLSLQYFYMLSGDDTLAKPDRHILRFIHQHTGKVPTMREAQELMTQTVAKLKNRYLNLNVRLLDYTIWDYMAHSAGKGK